jgi:hypothetical protein
VTLSIVRHNPEIHSANALRRFMFRYKTRAQSVKPSIAQMYPWSMVKMPFHCILTVSASSQVVNGFIENFIIRHSVDASRRYATFVERNWVNIPATAAVG